jgi:hypothetical protein
MNALAMSASTAAALVAAQAGQHRLGPVELADGRWFLSADALTEPRFAAMLVGVEYDVVPFEELPLVAGEGE